VLLGELKQHVFARVHHDPEVTVLAALGRLHEDARGVDAEVGGALGVGAHDLDEWLGELTKLVVPGAQGALGELEAVASVDALEYPFGLARS
jgi:hypothetical protein